MSKSVPKEYKTAEKDLDTELKNLTKLNGYLSIANKAKKPNPTTIKEIEKEIQNSYTNINKLNQELKEIANKLYPIPVRTFDKLKKEVEEEN